MVWRSVSGGCLEGDVIEKSLDVIASGKAQLYKYDTRQNAKNAFGMGYGCNSMLEIMIEPIAAKASDPVFLILKQIVSESNLQGLSTVFYTEDESIATIGGRLHSSGRTSISNAELNHLIHHDLKLAIKTDNPKTKTYKIDGKKVKIFHEVF